LLARAQLAGAFYGSTAIRQYGDDLSTWLDGWLGSDSIQLRNSYKAKQLQARQFGSTAMKD
jgi:hypothetical protein